MLRSGKQLSAEFSDMWEVKEVWIRLDLLPFQALAIFKSIAFGTSNTASIVNGMANGPWWEFNQMKQRGG